MEHIVHPLNDLVEDKEDLSASQYQDFDFQFWQLTYFTIDQGQAFERPFNPRFIAAKRYCDVLGIAHHGIGLFRYCSHRKSPQLSRRPSLLYWRVRNVS